MTNKINAKRVAVVAFAAVVLAVSILMSMDPSSAVTVNGSVVKTNRLQFVYSTSTSGNTTTVSWSLVCTRTSTNMNTYKKSAPTVVTINGSTVYNGNTYYDVRNGSKTIASGTATIGRTNGAALTVPFSASVNLSGTSVATTLTVSGNISLPAYTAGTKSITVNVDWIDNNDADGKRPENVTVTLYRNGEIYKTAVVSTDENKMTFTDLPAAYGGTAYKYTVSGSKAEDYVLAPASGTNITYTYAIVPELGFRIGFAI